MGGGLSVVSEEGAGSTFTVTLPLARPGEPVAALPAADEAPALRP